MKPEVEREWLFDQDPHEEFIIKVVTDPGVRSPVLEEAIRAAAQYVHDVATNLGIRVEIKAGRANQEASYTPSLSMANHERLADLDNRAIVVPVFYVKE